MRIRRAQKIEDMGGKEDIEDIEYMFRVRDVEVNGKWVRWRMLNKVLESDNFLMKVHYFKFSEQNQVFDRSQLSRLKQEVFLRFEIKKCVDS